MESFCRFCKLNITTTELGIKILIIFCCLVCLSVGRDAALEIGMLGLEFLPALPTLTMPLHSKY